MCGRFNFTDEQSEEIKAMIIEINERLHGTPVKTGEVYPTNLAAALVREDNRNILTAMTWGFPHFKGSGVIINAKSETVTEKRIFRNSVLERRCVIPTTGFYEWGVEPEGQQALYADPLEKTGRKQKYIFHLPGQDVLYLAGCYNHFAGEDTARFVILTTAANSSMEEIHSRMPVVLRPEERDAWVSDSIDFGQFFDRRDLMLEHITA